MKRETPQGYKLFLLPGCVHFLNCTFFKILQGEIGKYQFWDSDVIFNLDKPILVQLCRFPKASIEFMDDSGTVMSFLTSPSRFWGRNVILALHKLVLAQGSRT